MLDVFLWRRSYRISSVSFWTVMLGHFLNPLVTVNKKVQKVWFLLFFRRRNVGGSIFPPTPSRNFENTFDIISWQLLNVSVSLEIHPPAGMWLYHRRTHRTVFSVSPHWGLRGAYETLIFPVTCAGGCVSFCMEAHDTIFRYTYKRPRYRGGIRSRQGLG